VKKLVGALGALFVALALLVGPAGAADVPSASSRVSVSGTPAIGSAVTVVPGTWASTPDTRAYEWLRDGEGDVLSRDMTYTPSDADAGHTLVVVERVWFGSRQDETSSAPVATLGTPVAAPPVAAPPVAAPPATVAPDAGPPTVNTRKPTVKGTAKVGKTLKVRSKGTWTPKPSAYTYQWLRNGKAIKKATSSSYKLTTKDRKKKITLRVTAQRPGSADVAATSSKTKTVR